MYAFIKHIHQDYLCQSIFQSGLWITKFEHLLILFSIIRPKASIFILCNGCFMFEVLLFAFLEVKFRSKDFVCLIHHLILVLKARTFLYFYDKLGKRIRSKGWSVSIFSSFINGD